jgi:hypothetical protein
MAGGTPELQGQVKLAALACELAVDAIFDTAGLP